MFFHLAINEMFSQGKHICIGLDPDLDLVSGMTVTGLNGRHVSLTGVAGVFHFNQAVISATCDLVAAYKINPAFYLSLGRSGMDALHGTIDCIRIQAPEVPIIIDGKYGDVEHSNEHYASFVFEDLMADAVTLNPLSGLDHAMPFLDFENKGIFVVCRMSGSQELSIPSRTANITRQEAEQWGLYDQIRMRPYGETESEEITTGWWPNEKPVAMSELIIRQVAYDWNGNCNCGVVIGAGHLDEMRLASELRLPMLIPGIGSQGGELGSVISQINGRDFLVTSSRSILYSGYDQNAGIAARAKTEEMQNHIQQLLT